MVQEGYCTLSTDKAGYVLDGCDLFRAQKQAVFALCFEGCVC
jgi:hypothetical protein